MKKLLVFLLMCSKAFSGVDVAIDDVKVNIEIRFTGQSAQDLYDLLPVKPERIYQCRATDRGSSVTHGGICFPDKDKFLGIKKRMHDFICFDDAVRKELTCTFKDRVTKQNFLGKSYFLGEEVSNNIGKVLDQGGLSGIDIDGYKLECKELVPNRYYDCFSSFDIFNPNLSLTSERSKGDKSTKYRMTGGKLISFRGVGENYDEKIDDPLIDVSITRKGLRIQYLIERMDIKFIKAVFLTERYGYLDQNERRIVRSVFDVPRKSIKALKKLLNLKTFPGYITSKPAKPLGEYLKATLDEKNGFLTIEI